jgi:hypothetical protein
MTEQEQIRRANEYIEKQMEAQRREQMLERVREQDQKDMWSAGLQTRSATLPAGKTSLTGHDVELIARLVGELVQRKTAPLEERIRELEEHAERRIEADEKRQRTAKNVVSFG